MHHQRLTVVHVEFTDIWNVINAIIQQSSIHVSSNSGFQLWKLDQKAGWPVEPGAGGVNKLDYCVYNIPNVGELYMNYGKPLVMHGCLYSQIQQPEEDQAYYKRFGYEKPQNC
ncbi:MAG: hypothetical protein EZS28_018270 [Streblomastix strix]|uniref:Uncharacterized protein n=1 Tax=Streblomastix strix TaxID=222440 RepID=A0A5J4VU49_9EUKA|nr:MAG: hypothetical protein EZS28_018270 [Streblomastix strix]